MRSAVCVTTWIQTLRDLVGFADSSSSLSATSCSSSGVKSWVYCHDLHPSDSRVGLTAAKPVFAGANDSSSLDACRSVLGGAWEGLLPASARSSSCSRCWRLLNLGAIFTETLESFDPWAAPFVICCLGCVGARMTKLINKSQIRHSKGPTRAGGERRSWQGVGVGIEICPVHLLHFLSTVLYILVPIK